MELCFKLVKRWLTKEIFILLLHIKKYYLLASKLKLICYDVFKILVLKILVWKSFAPLCKRHLLMFRLQGTADGLSRLSELVAAVRTGCGELSLSNWPWTWNFSWNKWHVLTDLLLKVSYRENFENMLLLKIQCLVLLTTGHPHICGVTPGRKDIPKNPDCKL